MSKNKTQKILIPKGTVDPNEDTLIEIPVDMQKLPVVVAKKPGTGQNVISLERYSKNIEAGGNNYLMSEDRSSIRIKEQDKSYSPSHGGSLRNFQERSQNDSSVMKLEAMQKAQKGLNETAMNSNVESFSMFDKNESLTEPKNTHRSYQHSSIHSQKPIGSTSSVLSQVSCRTNQNSSTIGTNEALGKSKRTSSTCTNVSCNKSLQALKPPDSKDAPTDLTLSSKDVPLSSSTKRCEANVSFDVIPTASSGLSQVSHRTNQNSSTIGTNEALGKSKRTSSTCTNVSCNKSLQSLKPQNSKDALADLTSSSKDVPLGSSTKRCEVNVSFDVLPRGMLTDKEVSQKEDRAQSAAGLSESFFKTPCLKSSKRLREDKEVHVDSSEIEEKESCHSHVSRKKSKCGCGKPDKDSSSTGDDDSGDKGKMKKMFKCSENVIDKIYVEQLKRQFDEAKRKLEDAVILASITLKQMENKKYPSSSIGSCSSSRAISICDSVPERDVSFIPSSSASSKHRCRASFSDLNENSSSTLNRKENKWQKVDSGTSDMYKKYEIYENIRTKKHNKNKAPNFQFQPDTDSPCPFLKLPNPDVPTPRLYKVAKDRDTQTEQNSFKDITKEQTTAGKKNSMDGCNSNCSSTCGKASSNSLKFVTKPRSNFSDSDSVIEKISSCCKMNK